MLATKRLLRSAEGVGFRVRVRGEGDGEKRDIRRGAGDLKDCSSFWSPTASSSLDAWDFAVRSRGRRKTAIEKVRVRVRGY
jgi:hypothetical protein